MINSLHIYLLEATATVAAVQNLSPPLSSLPCVFLTELGIERLYFEVPSHAAALKIIYTFINDRNDENVGLLIKTVRTFTS
jgi:hypothetical protein